jgi:hypothetical protein
VRSLAGRKVVLDYSERGATLGSTEGARRAGTKLATTATVSIVMITNAKTYGSRAETLNRNARAMRATPRSDRCARPDALGGSTQ